MQTMKERLAGNRLREFTDFGLTVVTFLALVGMVGYYRISDLIRSVFWPDSQDRV